MVGGLVGRSEGTSSKRTVIAASYATAEVVVATIHAGASTGGLVGIGVYASVIASYAIGPVNSTGDRVGGLTGQLAVGSVTASYATGKVTGNILTGGLIGRSFSSSMTHSYWDTLRSGRSTSAGGTGKTTVQLQSPTSATGIYANWDSLDVNGNSTADEHPWTFGASDQYPVLKYAGMDTTAQFVAQLTPPGVPQGVTLTTSWDTLIVRWNAVRNATGYKVQWKSGDQNYAASRQASVTDTSSKISGLAVGTTYTVRVIATKTGAADGLPSTEVTGSLGAPRNVRVTPGVDSLTVTWDAVSGASGYRVQWKSGEENYPTADRQGNTYGQATIGDWNTTTYTIENLITGTRYTVHVIATRTGMTDSAPSAEVPGCSRDSVRQRWEWSHRDWDVGAIERHALGPQWRWGRGCKCLDH